MQIYFPLDKMGIFIQPMEKSPYLNCGGKSHTAKNHLCQSQECRCTTCDSWDLPMCTPSVELSWRERPYGKVVFQVLQMSCLVWVLSLFVRGKQLIWLFFSIVHRSVGKHWRCNLPGIGRVWNFLCSSTEQSRTPRALKLSLPRNLIPSTVAVAGLLCSKLQLRRQLVQIYVQLATICQDALTRMTNWSGNATEPSITKKDAATRPKSRWGSSLCCTKQSSCSWRFDLELLNCTRGELWSRSTNGF